jgi:hypothetical protein
MVNAGQLHGVVLTRLRHIKACIAGFGQRDR